MIYLHKKYKYSIRNINDTSDIWEGLFIDIPQYNNKNIILGNIYRPPKQNNNNTNIETFINQLSPIIHQFGRSRSNTIIAGDFNIDLLKVNDRPVFSDFFDLFVSNSFKPKVTVPTRLTDTTCTLIDNIFSSLTSSVPDISGVLVSNISDHLPCFTCFKNSVPHETNIKYIYKCCYRQDALNKYYCDLESQNIFDRLNTDLQADPNVNYDVLENILCGTKVKYLSHKRVRFNKYKHKRNQWITSGIIRSIKYRDNLYKTLKLTDPNSDLFQRQKQNLKVYNSILGKCIKNAKSHYFHSQFERFKLDAKKTWDQIKGILNKQKSNSLPSDFLIDGNQVSDKKIIADKFNIYFNNIGPDLASKIDTFGKKSFKSYLTNTPTAKFELHLVTEQEIINIIQNMQPKNTFGYDEISNKLLKHIVPVISKPLTLIINQSITTGIFPDKLKTAKIIPLYKKDNPMLLENYRPISLLPSISKVIEKVIYCQLFDYFTDHNLFYPNQYGFRKNHNTEQATLEVVDRITHLMEKGETPISIFLDLSKAFDTLNHEVLLYKLKFYGVNNDSLKLFKNYLTNRKQYVEYDHIQSETVTASTGVPQGSILGPLLFLIDMNDFHHATQFFHLVLYAYVATLLNPFKIQNTPTINNELCKIHDWLCVNKLSLNVNKTKYIIFHTERKNINIIAPNIQLSSTSIERVPTFNFLGIALHEHLKWKVIKTMLLRN